MAKAGEVLVNPNGDRLVFRKTASDTEGELLEVEMTYRPDSTKPPEHYHPHQEEHFEVQAGAILTAINGVEKTYLPGEEFTVPAGVPHWMRNTSEDEGRVIWQTRPAMRTEVFFETIWGLAADGKSSPSLLQMAVLGQDYADQFRLTSPPYGLQRLLFFILAPVGRLLGYRAEYQRYSQGD
jgi:quercetin dioxygenase-like cupin family protein